MSLAAGTRLGPYEIVAPLGAGGMGEVYKARDTRLDRTVAIKILPSQLAADPQFRERFDREARAISALEHPHICALHDVGDEDGTSFLVMQYLEGETLADRLTKGALPLEQALRYAIEIASALDTAHRHGITHRDLKPGNVVLTKSGAKLLDFGLAKRAGPAKTGHYGRDGVVAGFQAGPGDLSAALTMTSPITAQGMILGTFQYMAPEQLEGHEADPRTDIFAFGAVLYEMLTGKKAFEGRSQASLIAAILDREPLPTSSAQPLAPSALDRLVKKCLAKDPDERWQSAGDLHDELKWIAESGLQADIPAFPARVARPRPLRHVVIHTSTWLLGAAMAGTAVWLAMRTGPVPPPRVSRLQITPPSAATPTITALTFNNATRDVAITPDGTSVVYLGANGTALFVRALDRLDAMPLTGLGAPVGPFISPDGQWIGFAAAGTNLLKRVAITGGPAMTLAQLDGGFRGATWAADGTIVFAASNAATGLQRIAPDGGEPKVLTRPDPARGEADHFWPEFLPGGHAVLFTITAATGGLDQAQVAVLDLRTDTLTPLIPGGSDAHYVPSGHLVYGAAGTLRAVAFDLARLAIVGTAVTVVPQVVTTNAGAVDVAVAGGTLVYVPGGVGALQRMPVWVDRQGRETPISAPPHAYDNPRISPDGTRVALHAQDDGDIWLLDLVRSGLTRFTFDPGPNNYTVWTDDRRLVFGSLTDLFTQAADRTGGVTRLTERPNGQAATSISPDGSRLVFTETSSKTGADVMQLRLDGAHDVTPLVQTPSTERNGEVSPDGRWLAYEADDSASFEVYVQPFSGVAGGPKLVSTGGGRQPLWSRGGVQELFYLAPTGALMRVGVARGATWAATVPAQVLDGGRYYTGTAGQVGRSYDISLDGQRFLMIKQDGGSGSTPAPASLVVVQHFDEELKRLVPTKP
jgi:Tol biopolymer transport system component/predicted Ser/Thr protein kinase